jgi:hypothetical protein
MTGIPTGPSVSPRLRSVGSPGRSPPVALQFPQLGHARTASARAHRRRAGRSGCTAWYRKRLPGRAPTGEARPSGDTAHAAGRDRQGGRPAHSSCAQRTTGATEPCRRTGRFGVRGTIYIRAARLLNAGVELLASQIHPARVRGLARGVGVGRDGRRPGEPLHKAGSVPSAESIDFNGWMASTVCHLSQGVSRVTQIALGDAVIRRRVGG